MKRQPLGLPFDCPGLKKRQRPFPLFADAARTFSVVRAAATVGREQREMMMRDTRLSHRTFVDLLTIQAAYRQWANNRTPDCSSRPSSLPALRMLKGEEASICFVFGRLGLFTSADSANA